MYDEYQWWLATLLVAAGAALLWFLYGRLPRREEDVESEERLAEARWISERLNELGETAPPEVVAQVLELHRTYLVDPPSGAPFRSERVPPETALPEPVVADRGHPARSVRERLGDPSSELERVEGRHVAAERVEEWAEQPAPPRRPARRRAPRRERREPDLPGAA